MTAVLMYHGVGEAPVHSAELRYTVSAADFIAQMDQLARSGEAVTYPDFLEGRAPRRSVAVTFDDGEKSVATTALPVMRDHGLRGAVFVTTDFLGTEGYLDRADLSLLLEAGWVVGAHGVTHRYLSDLSDEELEREVMEPRAVLGEVLGSPPAHMSLPGGRRGSRVMDHVERAGYASLATSVAGLNSPGFDPFQIYRMMVLRGQGADHFRRIIQQDPVLILRHRCRQVLLNSAKHTLGNRRYDAWRRRVLDLTRG